jgi:RecA-family ATPase
MSAAPQYVPIEDAERRAAKPALEFINASSWQGVPVPPRRWLVPHRIPMANVTLLQGDGATGKTTIALQLCVASDQGSDWLGAMVPESGPCLFFSAEEDHDEIHRRLNAIVERRGLEFSSLSAVHVLGLPGGDPTLAGLVGNKVMPTPLMPRLEQAACDLRARLIVIEAAADVFDGDENNRGQVRHFIGLLRRLAQKADAAVVLLQHPSLTGLSSGSGNSGSTHWSNSVRSRLYFSKPKNDEGGGSDQELRQLQVMKANYGPAGERVLVRWDRGVFVLDSEPAGPERAARERAAEEAFLRCLDVKRRQGIEVVPTPGRGYAPGTFTGLAEAGGQSRAALKAAMERLLSAGRIRLDVVGGPPSKQRRGLVQL